MASGNAYRALDAWPDLPATPRLVLVTMALASRDNPTEEFDAAHYFGGPIFLQEKVWGRVDDSSARQLKKAITALVRAGALRRRTRGCKGRRAEYDLVLDRPDRGTETVPEWGTVLEPMGDQNGPDRGTETVPPKRTKGKREEREKENTSQVTTSPAPVDDDADPDSTLTDAERTERHNRQLIERHGLIPALRLIDGGKTA